MSPSPLTRRLSWLPGRVAGRLLLSLEPNPAVMNFVPVRLQAITQLIRDHLVRHRGHLVVVELGAGFSPRGIELARDFPDIEYIEIDLPGVVEAKRQRLEKVPGFGPPSNLHWHGADLEFRPLREVLGPRPIDLLSADGLLSYFPLDHIARILRGIAASLVPGGVFVGDIGWRSGMRHVQKAARIFGRQAGSVRGLIEDAEHARQLFLLNGFAKANVYLLSEMAERHQLSRPVYDPVLTIVARKAEGASAATSGHPEPR